LRRLADVVRLHLSRKEIQLAATPPPAQPAPTQGSSDGKDKKDPNLPDPSRSAYIWAITFLVLAIVVAVILDLTGGDQDPAFDPNKAKAADLSLFAGFFLAATAIERVLELIAPAIPWWRYPGRAKQRELAEKPTRTEAEAATLDKAIQQKKADRGYTILGLAALLGVAASGAVGLYLLEAVKMEAPRWLDMVATGIAVSGGTKGLHELIKTLQKAKGPTPAG
jgi:hypothetical protein